MPKVCPPQGNKGFDATLLVDSGVNDWLIKLQPHLD